MNINHAQFEALKKMVKNFFIGNNFQSFNASEKEALLNFLTLQEDSGAYAGSNTKESELFAEDGGYLRIPFPSRFGIYFCMHKSHFQEALKLAKEDKKLPSIKVIREFALDKTKVENLGLFYDDQPYFVTGVDYLPFTLINGKLVAEYFKTL
jgi:hypothetical protein